jgi:hypothetical protein
LEAFSKSHISIPNATTQLKLVLFQSKFQALRVLFYKYFCPICIQSMADHQLYHVQAKNSGWNMATMCGFYSKYP